MLTSKEIRQKFLDFFNEKGHAIVPSAPIVIKNDPTLMFTNAGMNQFKDLFLGNAPVKDARVADTQKCLRVSGKHNDLEEVGYDTYHHTMFEMLGNWSFGDYFKEDAINWAWELLTGVYGLDKNRLYVSVFGGDEQDGLATDTDAHELWLNHIDASRIINGSKKDNFWEMGETGPCGPCSEIHVDLRSDEERAAVDGKSLVNNDHPQVVEVWNLVFMEFNRKADGSLEKLPAKHVDTGMGFERLCMALQNKKSNYDTDVFQPIIREIEKVSGRKYGENEKSDIAMRVIADHLRAISFTIADGQLPANTGSGYVIRRILRRAIRYGYVDLDFREPFMYNLVDVLVAEMGAFFPEIAKQSDLVKKVMHEEEASFLRTAAQGLLRLDQIIEEVNGNVVEGAKAFELYDTFGFPVDLTALILRERGYQLDMAGFEAEMALQKERSRAATKLTTDDWVEIHEDRTEEFVGYDQLEAHVRITRYRKVSAKKKTAYQLVFSHTPFYPEGGGQVGDTGYIESDGKRISIIDTKKENGQIVHFAEQIPENPKFTFTAVVNAENRSRTANNHTATHLLHETLREVLGTHVEQKGSLVSPEHLRFDFSHFAKVTEDEIERIEAIVNGRIRANFALEEHRNIAIGRAKEMGAMALFGEKYGDTVRAIKFGSSIELCGGTHVQATGNIGLFKIVHESAVAAGIRRIEAITANAAEQFVRNEMHVLHEVKELLKSPNNPIGAIQSLKEENTKMLREVEQLRAEKARAMQGDLASSIEQVNGISFLAKRLDLDATSIKNLAFELKNGNPNLMLVFASAEGEKVNISVALGDELVNARKMNAGAIVKELAAFVKGGGGGQAFFAMAGGKDPDGIDAALNRAKEIAKNTL
jgi:alanyl-tRNA synthetase